MLLRRSDFESALTQAAASVFSGPEWDASFPEDEDKLMLLFFVLDRGGAYFKVRFAGTLDSP